MKLFTTYMVNILVYISFYGFFLQIAFGIFLLVLFNRDIKVTPCTDMATYRLVIAYGLH